MMIVESGQAAEKYSKVLPNNGSVLNVLKPTGAVYRRAIKLVYAR